ncbi:hypothetical protein AR443_05550 [Bacillus velezensis]|nr:hypothetical protein AR443_05550 [Bacillus velezensis]
MACSIEIRLLVFFLFDIPHIVCFQTYPFPVRRSAIFFVNQVNDVFFRFSGPNEFVIMFKWQETNGGTKTHVRC